MRDFSKVCPKLWRNEKFRNLSDSEKLMYVYLMAGPPATSLGCYILLPDNVLYDNGWKRAKTLRALEVLQECGLIEWDKRQSVVRLMGWFDDNPINNPSHAKGSAKRLDDIPEGPIKSLLIEELWQLPKQHAATALIELGFEPPDSFIIQDRDVDSPVDTPETHTNTKTRTQTRKQASLASAGGLTAISSVSKDQQQAKNALRERLVRMGYEQGNGWQILLELPEATLDALIKSESRGTLSDGGLTKILSGLPKAA